MNAQEAVLEEEAVTLAAQAKALAITDLDGYVAAGNFLTGVIKPMRKRIEEELGPVREANHKAWKLTVATMKRLDDPLEAAESHVKRGMERYKLEERRRLEEEERKASIERERIRREEEDKRLAEAAEMETAGLGAEAEAYLSEPVAPVAPLEAMAPAPAKAAGVGASYSWDFREIDPRKAKPEFQVVTLDSAKIRALVRSFGPRAVEMIGEGSIEVFERATISARAK
jgi:hypothetical protein